MVAFAVWTICCHIAMIAGWGLRTALLGYAFAAGAAAYGWHRFGGGAEACPPEALRVGDGPPRFASLLPPVAFALGAAAGVTYAVSGETAILWWSAVVLLGGAAVAVLPRRDFRVSTPASRPGLEATLWALALACSLLTLLWNRPDADDSFYVNVAVTAADFPDAALLAADSLHGIEGLPLHLPIYRLQTFELANGALSYLTGVPAIYCFHLISASLAALLVPLAHARLFRLLSPQWWLPATVTLVIVLVSVGDAYHWYGNLAFLRLWQGKSIYLSIVLPLVYAYAIGFSLRPSPRSWLLLAAAQVAAVGCTASAVSAAPLAALLALACAAGRSRRPVLNLALGGLASAYVLSAGALARRAMGALPIARETSWVALESAFEQVLGTGSLAVLALTAVPVAWTACSGIGRRFAIVVPLGALLVLLDPYSQAWVRSNLTGPAFWRAMWSLPIPILMTLVLVAPLRSCERRRPAVGGAAWATLVIAFAILVPSPGGLGLENNAVYAGRPTLKVHEDGFRWAAELNRLVPQGSYVVAPRVVSLYVPTFHRHAYPLMVRHYLDSQRSHIGEREYLQRHFMTRYADGERIGKDHDARFRRGLERFAVKAVCLRITPEVEGARGVLRRAGFRRAAEDPRYEIWVRSRAPAKRGS